MSTETVRTIKDRDTRTATSIFAQLLSSDSSSVQCCFTSTETVRIIRDGEPRTATLIFTQLLSSEGLSYVQCCFTSTETIKDQDGHFDSHTAPKLW